MSTCENCHRPATIAWPSAYGGEALTCDDCKPAAWDTAKSPRSLAATSKTDLRSKALLNRADAAAYLGDMSVDHFDKNVRQHVKVRMVGSVPMFRPADLDAFAAGGAKEL